ncbi:MAG: sulfite exporter TauE/SafE family protein [Spirochaetes bacterium]|nr:sulfite exporter TauE/SafE family protein [Spirochaetota bacterium]
MTIAGIIEPLVLGFSTGTWCVMYCAPVLLPFLTAREGLNQKRNIQLIGLFLGGRLFAYVLLGLCLGAAGLLVMEFFDPVLARRISYVAYIFCGIVLLLSGFRRHICNSGKKCFSVVKAASGDPMTALFSGICVGFHICPPFWTAAVRSAAIGNPLAGSIYFLLFYAGTLPFFLPLLGIPFFNNRFPGFRKIAHMTQVLIGAYFLIFAGLIPFIFRR